MNRGVIDKIESKEIRYYVEDLNRKFVDIQGDTIYCNELLNRYGTFLAINNKNGEAVIYKNNIDGYVFYTLYNYSLHHDIERIISYKQALQIMMAVKL